VRSELIPDLFARLGEPGFRVLEVQLLPVALRPGAVVATGGGTLTRHENREVLAREAFAVWLDAPFDVLWDRISRSAGRPVAEALGRDELESLYESRRAAYADSSLRVDATRPIEEVAQQVVQAWTG
jgi:shikimate kinase